MGTPHAPPLAKHLSQSPAAYLRQVTDQMANPKPAPHYEVVTMSRVWKFKPGNSNLFEALALLVHALKRHQPRSYQLLPQQLRNVIESTTSGNLPGALPGGFPVGLPIGIPGGLPVGMPGGLPVGMPGGLPR